MGIVHDAVTEYIHWKSERCEQAWRARHPEGQTKLNVSDLGWCVRRAYLPLFGVEPTHPFDAYTEAVINAGNVWETETGKALKFKYGDQIVVDQDLLRVSNDKWAGRKDFLFKVGSVPQYPHGAIVEHKDTDNKNFTHRIPYQSHCLQLLMYKHLYGDPRVATLLYYHGRGRWAEFEVWETDAGIAWKGEVQGASFREKSGLMKGVSLYDEVAQFEVWWGYETFPPRKNPFEGFGCCRKGRDDKWRPACRYFGACWPELDSPPFTGKELPSAETL